MLAKIFKKKVGQLQSPKGPFFPSLALVLQKMEGINNAKIEV